jgi:hypothetical protein
MASEAHKLTSEDIVALAGVFDLLARFDAEQQAVEAAPTNPREATPGASQEQSCT